MCAWRPLIVLLLCSIHYASPASLWVSFSHAHAHAHAVFPAGLCTHGLTSPSRYTVFIQHLSKNTLRDPALRPRQNPLSSTVFLALACQFILFSSLVFQTGNWYLQLCMARGLVVKTVEGQGLHPPGTSSVKYCCPDTLFLSPNPTSFPGTVIWLLIYTCNLL